MKDFSEGLAGFQHNRKNCTSSRTKGLKILLFEYNNNLNRLSAHNNANSWKFKCVQFEITYMKHHEVGGGARLEWSGVETHNTDDLNILISKEFSKFISAKTQSVRSPSRNRTGDIP